MLDKKRRINKGLFGEIGRSGRSFFSDLSVRILPMETSSDPSAFAFVVSGKEVKTAVRRNFLKRRARYAVSQLLDKIKDGYYIVFYLKKAQSDLPYPKFKETVINGLSKANLLK